ncbi:MAG: winged helix DNA-binding protein [Dehalococcoidales bacterium]|nr:winged helix DNA-binding protein [Dehalococcoidales bacterium]
MEKTILKNQSKLSKVNDPFVILPFLLKQTSDTIMNAIELELKRHNVNIPQAVILYFLAREERPVTILEISRFSVRELNSVSFIINKMEKEGLVSKVSQPGKRKTYVTLSSKGADLFYNHITENAQYLIFSVLTQAEREEFEINLRKLLHKARNAMGMDFKPSFLP